MMASALVKIIIIHLLNIINNMNICVFSFKKSDKKSILISQIISTIFTIILGTILHFTYQWSDKNLIVGSFSAVNESTWEHLKLLFFPMLITTIIGYFYLRKNIPNFLCAKAIGIITAIVSTIVIFYTYTGILGTNFAFLNILTFIISAILGEYISYKIMLSDIYCNNKIAVFLLIILFLCFVLFTYFTPVIGLFKDPISSKYGINSMYRISSVYFK